MKNSNQITKPTASSYIASIRHLLNVLSNVPDNCWEPTEISTLHEIDDTLDQVRIYFEDIADEKNHSIWE